MADILKQDLIFGLIANLQKEVRLLKRRFNLQDRLEDLDGPEQPEDGSVFYNQYIFFPVLVSSIVNETTFLGLRVIPNTVADTPWVIDTDFQAKPLTVCVPMNVTMPAEEDYVNVHFTGTSGDSPAIPKYGLFGAGGGGVTQMIVTGVNNDHLVCRTFLESVQGATDILVAKNYKLRRTPFDGNTIGGITYTYSNALAREATSASCPSLQEIQEVIPTYLVGSDIIYVAQPNGGTGVTVGATPVIFIDVNADARAWARTGVP